MRHGKVRPTYRADAAQLTVSVLDCSVTVQCWHSVNDIFDEGFGHGFLVDTTEHNWLTRSNATAWIAKQFHREEKQDSTTVSYYISLLK